MAYISDFGIGFAARIAGLALLSMSAGALAAEGQPQLAAASVTGASLRASVPNSTLEIDVAGLRSTKGIILICLTANPASFPDCEGGKDSRLMRVFANKAGAIEVKGLAPGNYAISLVHDENANGRLDKAILIPREGFGFSRNPKITFGPPKFSAVEVNVGQGDVKIPVKMKYYF
jgi:uncharacterized protein (DUF2141 family)